MTRKLLMLVMVLFTQACAQSEVPKVAIPPTAKSVGIVASIPPKFRVATTGLTVFENALDVIEVSEWRLQDLAMESMEKALSPRFRVSRPLVDGEIYDSDVPLTRATSKVNAMEDAVRKKVRPTEPVDLLVTVTLGERAQPYRQVHNILFGIGASKMRNVFRTIDPMVHTYLLVTVFDGSSMTEIARTPLQNPRPGKQGFVDSDEPAEELQGFDWKDHWSEMTDQQRVQIRERTEAMLQDAIPFTLRKLGLAPN